VPDKVHTLL
jgi:predicted protein tyrosine phosphatase